MRKFAVGMLLIGVALLTACKKEKNIYPDNPWAGDPGVRVLAVAPFLIQPEIAMQMRQPFECGSFQTRDGATVYFSPDFAKAFADGLTHFNGLQVVHPDRVMRAWVEAVEMGQMTNPLGTPEDAKVIARRLNCDAILVGEVMEWDPQVTRMTINYTIHATRTSAIRATDIRRVENAGKGGLLERGSDRSAMPLYGEQLTLDREQSATRKLLREYSHSLSGDDNQGYATREEAVVQRPYPRFIRFAAWVAICNAFSGTTTEPSGSRETAGGE